MGSVALELGSLVILRAGGDVGIFTVPAAPAVVVTRHPRRGAAQQLGLLRGNVLCGGRFGREPLSGVTIEQRWVAAR